jgi:hypothetical protein
MSRWFKITHSFAMRPSSTNAMSVPVTPSGFPEVSTARHRSLPSPWCPAADPSASNVGPGGSILRSVPTWADTVLVTVRDSGPSIDPEHVERVFQAFYTTKPSAVGMGLSICRSIIEAHGGRLWADANEPRGA